MPQFYAGVPAAEVRKIWAKNRPKTGKRNKKSRCRIMRALERAKRFKKARKAQVLYDLSRKEVLEIVNANNE